MKTYVDQLLAKFEVRDRTEAVVFAWDKGFVPPGRAAVAIMD